MLTRIDFLKLIPSQQIVNSLSLAYYYNHQRRHDNTVIYQSNYALDYLRHKLLVSFDHNIWQSLSATWYLRWQERKGTFISYVTGAPKQCKYKPYTMFDLKIRWTGDTYELYTSLENLLSRRYYDLGAVPQPGFTFLVGANYKFQFRKKHPQK